MTAEFEAAWLNQSVCLFQTGDGKVHFFYKKVAVVENFFDIIYSVHVESAADTQVNKF